MFYINHSKRSIAAASEQLIAAADRHGMTAVGQHIMKWHEIQPDAEHGPECRIYDFCNAAWMRQSLEGSQLAAAALPCRVAVYEDRDGVSLALMKVAAYLAASTNARVHEPFGKMEKSLIEAVREVCDGRPGVVDLPDRELADVKSATTEHHAHSRSFADTLEFA